MRRKIKIKDSLFKKYPKLAREWHPVKNGSLTPKDITPGSNKKVWWKCNKGHEWFACVNSRSTRNGCPYCSNKRVCKDNCLATNYPELAKEWHPTKNGSLTPKDVIPGSKKKVWWICKKKHEWQGGICYRKYGSGCPYCSGKSVCKDNCLATINPKLAKEWHPTKNGTLTPKDVTWGSNRKVWWLCKKGHEWLATIHSRKKGIGCPYCSGKSVCKDNCLATINPKLAKEWHPTKNGTLTPKDVAPGSNKKVWWICKKKHEWQAVVCSRNKGNRCPYCIGKYVCKDNCLATINPKLAKEWHPEKNGTLTPNDVTPGSGKKVWWICRKGHEWLAKVCSRTNNRGCPYCCGQKVCEDNCLATKNPALAKEWHPEKNGSLTPHDVIPGSTKKVWWKCFYGHEWQASIRSRNRGNGCMGCYIKLRKEGFYSYSHTPSVNIRRRK